MKKLRSKQSNLQLSKNKLSNLDLWISRASHLSQVGILIIAVIVYFYTVIPIYQKSILDEDIAKKTLELKLIKNEIYVKQRRAIVSSFMLKSDFKCSGLLERPEKLLKLGEKRLSIIERNPILFDSTTSKCLADLFISSDLKGVLNKVDYKTTSKKIISISANLEKDQKLAQNNFYMLSNAAKLNPNILEPIEPNTYTSNMFDFLKKTYPETDFNKQLEMAKIEQAQSKIIHRFRESISIRIKELSKINWLKST